MKSPSLIAAAIGLSLLAAPAPAQNADEAPGGEAETTTDTDAAADYGLDTPLAVIDGTALTLGELIALRRELPEQYQQLPDLALYQGILEQLVDQLLLAEAAREAGLDQRPAVALSLLNQRRALLADAYLAEEVRQRVGAEQVEAAYQERYVEAEPIEEVRAAHILVETEEEAKALKAELDAGADFAELAREHGTDGTATRGGELGWFTRSEMVPAFADAVFAMESGTVEGPVETDFGWHLIKLEERRPRPAPPLEEVEEELVQELTRAAQLKVIDELRAEAEITRPEAPVPPEAIRADGMLDAAE